VAGVIFCIRGLGKKFPQKKDTPVELDQQHKLTKGWTEKTQGQSKKEGARGVRPKNKFPGGWTRKKASRKEQESSTLTKSFPHEKILAI
jgi:hypothetical protein